MVLSWEWQHWIMSCSDTFRKSATVDVNSSTLITVAWLSGKTHFPMVALDLVAVPASPAYIERVFSVCGNMCTGKHNRMSVSLETHVFLRINKTTLERVLQQMWCECDLLLNVITMPLFDGFCCLWTTYILQKLGVKWMSVSWWFSSGFCSLLHSPTFVHSFFFITWFG